MHHFEGQHANIFLGRGTAPPQTPPQCECLRQSTAQTTFHAPITSNFEYAPELHWLPILQRVEFKLVLLVYKALHDATAAYLVDDCQLVSHAGVKISPRRKTGPPPGGLCRDKVRRSADMFFAGAPKFSPGANFVKK